MGNVKKKQRVLMISSIVFFSLFCPSFGQLHFVSLGSFGKGSVSTQTAVASTLKIKAKENAVSFLISPGSNFADGVTSLNDTKWASSFETPYEGPAMSLPFFTVVGTEDWKGNYSALALRTNATYGATDKNAGVPRWYLPNWWYHYIAHFSDSTGVNAALSSTDGSVGFVFVDTYILANSFKFPSITKLHWDNLRDTVAAAVRIFDWVIAVGDKAILSSGSSHGDEHLGTTLRPFLKDMKVDMYISGNDPDMEVIEDGTLVHMNCGAASGGSRSGSRVENSKVYVGKAGFCNHILTKGHLITEFVDGHTGLVLANYTKARNIRDRSFISRFYLYKGLPEITYIEIPKGVVQRPGEGRGPRRGPGTSGGAPTPGDPFVRIVGTLGLIILFGLLALGGTVGTHAILVRKPS